MIKIKNLSIKKILSYIATIISTIFITFIGHNYYIYLNRSIINIDIKRVTIREKKIKDWESFVKIMISNSGRSETFVQFTTIEYRFPKYSSKPFYLKIDKFIKLPPKSKKEDEIMTIFPSIFDTLDMNKIPNLDRVTIGYKKIDSDETSYISQDSSNIVHQILINPSFINKDSLNDIIIDNSKKEIDLNTKDFYINYKGIPYKNKIYPRDTNVEYQIKNDKICLQFSINKPEYIPISKSHVFEPPILFIHPKIKDKIVYPKTHEFNIEFRTKERNKTMYENIKINMESMFKQFIYTF